MNPGLPQDNLKWFGEGFEGFPKRLPEDTVEYAVYVVDSTLSDAQVRTRLNSILQTSHEICKKFLKDYIWQREEYKLELRREQNTWALLGRTNYGDSIDDEWLIVYLLRELSKKFNDIWIRVYDTDGEFLLIEAANVLPKWLNPEIAENRVWLHSGNLRIIPLSSATSSQDNKTVEKKALSVQEALTFIKNSPTSLIHSPLVESEAFYRIRNHPSSISSTFHHSSIRIPRKLAYILHRKPALISPAIEAFYLRDPISMRTLHTQPSKNSITKSSSTSPSSQGGLIFSPEDLISTVVKFTKVGFAQLRSQQRYDPPKIWAKALRSGSQSTASLSDPMEASNPTQVGMRVSCGFEMLLSDPQIQSTRAVREVRLLLDDLESGEEELPTDEEIAKWERKADTEEWLDVDFNAFEQELSGRKADAKDPEKGEGLGRDKNGAAAGSGFGDKAAQENLRKMVERFEAFLNDDEAGVDGVDDMDFDDDDEDEDDDSDSEEDKDVSFDEVEFARVMREMMGMPGDSKLASKDLSGKEKVMEDTEKDDSEEEARAFQSDMRAIETELKSHGALDRNPPSQKIPASMIMKGKEKAIEQENKGGLESDDEDEDEGHENDEVDIDFNLVKNMLESLKGQAGLAGPAGNMMSRMGINMPRDEDEGAGTSKR